MIPLIFAAAVTLSPAAAQPSPGLDAGLARAPLPRITSFSIVAPNPLAACAKLAEKTVAPDGVPLKKLGELPPGLLEHAELRSVNGSPVREIVFAGQTYYLQGSAPQIERVDPVGPSIKQR
jgi:hypothetical protein